MKTIVASPVVITPKDLLEHWQGHRRLTRKVIEVFPDEKLFTYSIGGMRPFSALVLEMTHMAGPGVKGFATGNWVSLDSLGHHSKDALQPKTKRDLLQYWDEVTELISITWPLIAPGRYQETDRIFGIYDAPIYSAVFYLIDNEVHHRGQGYVYLRSLGMEPPAFWDRA